VINGQYKLSKENHVDFSYLSISLEDQKEIALACRNPPNILHLEDISSREIIMYFSFIFCELFSPQDVKIQVRSLIAKSSTKNGLYDDLKNVSLENPNNDAPSNIAEVLLYKICLESDTEHYPRPFPIEDEKLKLVVLGGAVSFSRLLTQHVGFLFFRPDWARVARIIKNLIYVFDDCSIKITSALHQNLGAVAMKLTDYEFAHQCFKKSPLFKYEALQAKIYKCAKNDKNLTKAIRLSSQAIQIYNSDNYHSPKMGQFKSDVAQIALDDLYNRLNEIGLKPFLVSGTLLGYERNGAIFDHDKDFDLGIIGWEAQFDIAECLLKSGVYGFDYKQLVGKDRLMISGVHKPTGVGWDIFFYNDMGDYFLNGVNFALNYTLEFHYSKFQIEEKRYGKKSYNVPNNIAKYLTETYGPDWHTPQENYLVHMESPILASMETIDFKFHILVEMMKAMTAEDFKKGLYMHHLLTSTTLKKYAPDRKVMFKFLSNMKKLQKKFDLQL
jgi:tetratricopeptide (TPR) repeat protein